VAAVGDVRLGGGQGGVGHEWVIPPHGKQRVRVAGIFDAAHHQPHGERADAAQPQRVAGFGDLGIGDQLAGVGVFDRSRIVHRGVGVLVDTSDCGADGLVSGHRQGELDTFLNAGGTHRLVPNAESPRSMIVAIAPHSRAVPMAALTCQAAARPEPALPLRSRASAITGAARSVDRVVICGDRPSRSSARLAILACPNEAPCLRCPSTGRPSEWMSKNARCSMPGNSGVRAASAARCSRATAASWLACPKVNSRKKIPSVEGAYTSSNTRGVPPARSTPASSMLSAPQAIAAIIDVNFPTGFTAPDFTRVDGRSTRSSINRERPACSASSNTGTRPAADTKFCSSNTADSVVNVYDECTENAFPNSGQHRLKHS